MPAHVTILYPFKPPHELTAVVIETLAELFSPLPAFPAALTEIRRFPGVLYLAPEPDQSIRRLTQLVAARFPETPPYGGQFADVIPHLTVADVEDQARLEQITSDFILAAAGQLPVQTMVREIALMENTTGLWQVRHRFALGG